MIFSREHLQQLAESTGFQMTSLEKQMHLLHILREIRRHPYLQDQFALKGGTAINVYIQSLPRLSVDIDLNFVGAVAVEEMRAERPRIEKALQRTLKAQGYTVKRIPEEHAGGKWRLQASSAFGGTFALELDINYMYRVPLGAVQYKSPAVLDEDYRVPFPIVSMEELYAGKILALLDRGAARDLYDVFRAVTERLISSDSLLKPLILFLGIAQRSDWREVTSRAPYEISDTQVEAELIPMLRQEESFHLKKAQEIVAPFLQDLLDYSPAAEMCIQQFLDQGELKPEGVIKDPDMIADLKKHPAIRWKLQNVRQYLG